MARRYITIGSLGSIHGYDDVDYDKAIVTEGPISSGAPVDDSDVLRKEDMGSLVGIEGTVTGDIIRWNELTDEWEVVHFPFDPVIHTDSHVLLVSELNISHRMNSAADKIFTLPSVGASEDGSKVTLMKIGSGKLTVQAVDTDFISDSSATGTIYSTTALASITLEYVHAITTWVVQSPAGIWTTT